MRPRAFAGAVVTAAVLSACMVMSGLELQQAEQPTELDEAGKPKKDGSSNGASGTSGTTSGVVDPGECQPAREPAKPAADSPGGADTPLAFAIKEMVANNTGPAFGLDLDGVCTCQGTPAGLDACKRETSSCDEPGGLDNAAATVFRGAVSASGGGINLVQLENDRIKAGKNGVLVKVENWNGQADDVEINVSVIRSRGIADFDGSPGLTWPSSDVSYPATGYVANKVLVARFAEVEIPFLSDTPLPPKMKGAILMGTIGEGNTVESFLLAGRTGSQELANAIGQINHPTFGGPICHASDIGIDLYERFGASICRASDLPTDPSSDRDLNIKCDAISFGVKMLMVPAVLGGKESLDPVPDRCEGIAPIICE